MTHFFKQILPSLGLSILLLVIVSIAAPTQTVSAKADPAAAKTCNKDACDLVDLYLNPIINILSGIVGVVVAGSIILGGIQYSASDGDPQKAAKAKSRITNALFALIAYLFIWAFLQFLVPGGVFNR